MIDPNERCASPLPSLGGLDDVYIEVSSAKPQKWPTQ